MENKKYKTNFTYRKRKILLVIHYPTNKDFGIKITKLTAYGNGEIEMKLISFNL